MRTTLTDTRKRRRQTIPPNTPPEACMRPRAACEPAAPPAQRTTHAMPKPLTKKRKKCSKKNARRTQKAPPRDSPPTAPKGRRLRHSAVLLRPMRFFRRPRAYPRGNAKPRLNCKRPSAYFSKLHAFPCLCHNARIKGQAFNNQTRGILPAAERPPRNLAMRPRAACELSGSAGTTHNACYAKAVNKKTQKMLEKKCAPHSKNSATALCARGAKYEYKNAPFALA